MTTKKKRYNKCIKGLVLTAVMLLLLLCSSETTLASEMIRSTSLNEVETEIEDGITRIDYINASGEITYAADKHYASLIKTKLNDKVLFEYFDASGQPAKQPGGYYAALYSFDNLNQNIQIEYLGTDKSRINISTGFSIERHLFNEKGQLEWVHYLDANENPIRTSAYGYGCYKKYNGIGENTEITYLDQNDQPMITSQGFAIKQMEYYKNESQKGRLKYQLYFDEAGNPIALSRGQYGIYKEYDKFGRNDLTTYLGKDRQPIITNAGYATVKRTFYEDDSIRTEMYFDESGQPVRLSEGQYGIKYEDGRAVYLNKNGTELFNFKLALYNSEWLVILGCIVLILLSIALNKKANVCFLGLYVMVIIYMTLMYRVESGSRYNFELFQSYRKLFFGIGGKDILNNILLFAPLGTIFYKLYPRKFILLVPFFLSALIEVIQYFTGTGLCELDDILNNCIGGILGYCVGHFGDKIVFKLLKIRKKYTHS